jgi:hypothetical protein
MDCIINNIDKNNLKKYYENDNKSIINDNNNDNKSIINNLNLKKLLELSSITNLNVFTNKKKKNIEWKLKEKRILLKECDIIRKQKIKQVSESLNKLSKNKSKNLLLEVKNKNNNLLDDIETIDTLIETIENDYPLIDKNNFLEKFSN